MNKKLKTILGGIGSVLAIFPSTNYAEFIPKGSSHDRIRSHWVRFGNNIQSSINRFSNDTKKAS